MYFPKIMDLNENVSKVDVKPAREFASNREREPYSLSTYLRKYNFINYSRAFQDFDLKKIAQS